ncbi:MOSC domain-containing protein [Massariosphaeria phaeospora]|uniref:MOSC domain-containing protein n=1 Tax=Massariosphaeria phaeospora TaxID=100035 RepID=A0A7C8MEU6_9PLEO|nr:MOSC domain-containing protein [Massariosphaeria phaeospora]
MSSQYLPLVLALAIGLLYYLMSFLHKLVHRLQPMKISEIYVYPIKSLRGVQLSEALATRHGFEYDRTFMLLQVTPEGHKNMAVSGYPAMTQFLTDIETDGDSNGTITVDFIAFGDVDQAKTLKVPLRPDTEKLEPFQVNMHYSPTQAFKMPAKYSEWFSSCFGYEVVFVYLGDNKRDVLFEDMKPDRTRRSLPPLLSSVPFLNLPEREAEKITFTDCAPFLIVSKTSLADVSARLPEGEEMDITKFRANIVIEGAPVAWAEDYWAKIKVKDAEIIMQHNCIRCKSINIDYSTGKPGVGESGDVLKKLQKDRRIDDGAKWSPVFGRYSFWSPKTPPRTLRVGDEVNVVRLNTGTTSWTWKGLQ